MKETVFSCWKISLGIYTQSGGIKGHINISKFPFKLMKEKTQKTSTSHSTGQVNNEQFSFLLSSCLLKAVCQYKIVLYNSLQMDIFWLASKVVFFPLRNLCWACDVHQQQKTLENGCYFGILQGQTLLLHCVYCSESRKEGNRLL